jgi:hypothetical protein
MTDNEWQQRHENRGAVGKRIIFSIEFSIFNSPDA